MKWNGTSVKALSALPLTACKARCSSYINLSLIWMSAGHQYYHGCHCYCRQRGWETGSQFQKGVGPWCAKLFGEILMRNHALSVITKQSTSFSQRYCYPVVAENAYRVWVVETYHCHARETNRPAEGEPPHLVKAMPKPGGQKHVRTRHMHLYACMWKGA